MTVGETAGDWVEKMVASRVDKWVGTMDEETVVWLVASNVALTVDLLDVKMAATTVGGSAVKTAEMLAERTVVTMAA